MMVHQHYFTNLLLTVMIVHQSSLTNCESLPTVSEQSTLIIDDGPPTVHGRFFLQPTAYHAQTMRDNRPQSILDDQPEAPRRICTTDNLIVQHGPVQETGDRSFARLSYMPTTLVERGCFLLFTMLLLTIAELLESSNDEQRFRRWVRQFNVCQDTNIFGLLSELDRLDVISVLDLGRLREFLVNIGRMDVVYLIDRFHLGDYALLRLINFCELGARKQGKI